MRGLAFTRPGTTGGLSAPLLVSLPPTPLEAHLPTAALPAPVSGALPAADTASFLSGAAAFASSGLAGMESASKRLDALTALEPRLVISQKCLHSSAALWPTHHTSPTLSVLATHRSSRGMHTSFGNVSQYLTSASTVCLCELRIPVPH